MKTSTKTITLFDNYDWQFDEIRTEIAKEEGLAIEDISETEVYDRITDNEQWEWNEALNALKAVEKNGEYWLVMGDIGNWKGIRQGANIFDSVDKMMDAVTKECDYVKIEYDLQGHLYIKSSHHDGSNNFECKLLTRKGYNAYENWDYSYDTQKSEYEMLENLWKCNIFSKLPHIEIECGLVQ